MSNEGGVGIFGAEHAMRPEQERKRGKWLGGRNRSGRRDQNGRRRIGSEPAIGLFGVRDAEKKVFIAFGIVEFDVGGYGDFIRRCISGVK